MVTVLILPQILPSPHPLTINYTCMLEFHRYRHTDTDTDTDTGKGFIPIPIPIPIPG